MQAGIAVGNLASAVGISAEDAGLVAELKSGSESAFAQLIALYHQPVYSLVARSLQDPADAAHITQEVFIKVYRGICGFHGESSLRTWIYRIALHEASNQRRWWTRHKRQEITIESCVAGRGSASRFQRADDPNAPCLRDTLADERNSPFDNAASSEVRTRVERGLRQVPEIFRTVLVLREIEGFSYDEIAEILAINVGTVKSRLVRGRQALRLALSPPTVAAPTSHLNAFPRLQPQARQKEAL
jgi:RNA polymerase sigma-70 factor (ECF subfamily)